MTKTNEEELKELRAELGELRRWKYFAGVLLEDGGTYSIPAKLETSEEVRTHRWRMEDVENIAFELDLDLEEIAQLKVLDGEFLSMLSDRINVVQIKDHGLREAHTIITEKIKARDREIKSLKKSLDSLDEGYRIVYA